MSDLPGFENRDHVNSGKPSSANYIAAACFPLISFTSL